MDDAVAAGQPEPDAMTLATAGADGAPAARMVLLKGCDERGFTFFTNYRSAKAAELAANPAAALVFRWEAVGRQVRVTGAVTKVDAAESDAYFATRPLESQLGAWASDQSQVIPDRAVLERRLSEASARFAGSTVPRPPHWGGFRVTPTTLELWQQGAGRLHDRFRYRRSGAGWELERLSP